MARFLLFFPTRAFFRVSDPTTGLKATRVAEVPLRFGLRVTGESKITSQTPGEIFKTVFHLRWHDEVTRRFLRFGIVGFSGFLVNALILELFAQAAFTASIAHLFSVLAKHRVLGFIVQQSA